MQHTFGSMEHASLFYHGGITVYNIGQKSKQLNVGPIHALQVNCVSEKVAIEMAIGVIHMFKSSWGIGITGYASPVPESGGALFFDYFRYCVCTTNGLLKGKLVPDQAGSHSREELLCAENPGTITYQTLKPNGNKNHRGCCRDE